MPGLFRHPPFPQWLPDVIVTSGTPPAATPVLDSPFGIQHAQLVTPAKRQELPQQSIALSPGVTQAIIPAGGILIAVTPGAPTMQGGPQTVIIPTGLRISVAPGTPSLTGGSTLLQCFIGNVERSAYLLPAGLSPPRTGGGGGGGGTGAAASGMVQVTSNAIGRAEARFDLYVSDASFIPRAKQTVILQEYGVKLFAGCLKTVTTDPVQPGFTQIVYHCIATDKSSLCDGRVVIKTYKAGDDLATVILDIVANFLNGEGITTGGVNVPGLTLGADLISNHNTVTQVFDAITAQTGAQWWVDMNGELNFAVLTHAPSAPFSLSESSNNFRNLVLSETLTGYANKFYAVSNLIVLPSQAGGASGTARTETYTFVNHPYAGSPAPWQEAAWIAGLAPGYVLLDLPIAVLVSVKVNSVSIPVYGVSQGIIASNSYYYFDGSNTAAVIFPDATFMSIGQTIEVKYIPVYQNSTVNTGPALSGTCGSGLIEAVIQVPNISDQGELDAIAQAYQDRAGVIPYLLNFETDKPGLQVGQALSVDFPSLNLAAATTYITSVRAVRADAGQFDLGSLGSFRYVVEATTQQNLGNWVTWFERLITRTQFPLPVGRFERASFVLAPGTSLSAGAVSTNPYIVQNAGLVYIGVAAAGTAPVGQDLLIDFLVNGVSVYGTAPLVIPAGSTAVATSSVFAVPGLAVYKYDVIEITVSYRTSSLSVTAAQSVSAYLEWTY